MILIKRIGISLLIILIYFTAWSHVRGVITSYTVLPQIEFAEEYCESVIHYEQSSPTSTNIYVYNTNTHEYDIVYYTTPAGFYLLFGILFLILAGGPALFYKWLIGFHISFWLLTILAMIPGFCLHPWFLHITNFGIKYITPFVTFLLIILILTPNLKKKLISRHKLH